MKNKEKVSRTRSLPPNLISITDFCLKYPEFSLSNSKITGNFKELKKLKLLFINATGKRTYLFEKETYAYYKERREKEEKRFLEHFKTKKEKYMSCFEKVEYDVKVVYSTPEGEILKIEDKKSEEMDHIELPLECFRLNNF